MKKESIKENVNRLQMGTGLKTVQELYLIQKVLYILDNFRIIKLMEKDNSYLLTKNFIEEILEKARKMAYLYIYSKMKQYNYSTIKIGL